jgi:hypothetical protein
MTYAHPADEGRQDVVFSIRDGQLAWSHDLWMGPLIALPFWSQDIDTNRDQAASLDEQNVFANRFASNIELRIDGEPVPFTLASVDVAPYARFLAQPASPQVRLVFTAPVSNGDHTIEYRSLFDPGRMALSARFPSGGGVAVRNPQVVTNTYTAQLAIKPEALSLRGSDEGAQLLPGQSVTRSDPSPLLFVGLGLVVALVVAVAGLIAVKRSARRS